MSRQPQAQANYLSEDTVAALSSAVGGAVAIIRISGPQSFEILKELTQATRPGLAEKSDPRKLYLARIHGLDEVLFVRFKGPDSYTGEDVVELHIHGGAYVASRILETTLSLGARQALPGEFSFRAVRNGKMTLSQAAAVADLISATNDDALSLALEKLSGTQHRLIQSLASDLRTLSALGEIGIDFSDQGVDEVSLPRLREHLDPIVQSLVALKNSYGRGYRIQEGVSVTFVGLPNAGKSSFFNALLGEDRSIVSDIPGTTRDVVHEKMTLRARNQTVTLRLEDTAGLRSTADQIEQIGVSRSEKSARKADLVLFVIDPTVSPNLHREQWERLNVPVAKTVAIITKIDLIASERTATLRTEYKDFGISRWVETSAITGVGMDQAVAAITEACSQLTRRDQGEVVLTRLDQVDAVKRALEDLNRAKNAPEIELFAADVRQALHSMTPLIGETATDDILGQIFSEFCIGK